MRNRCNWEGRVPVSAGSHDVEVFTELTDPGRVYWPGTKLLVTLAKQGSKEGTLGSGQRVVRHLYIADNQHSMW